jgi:hypothetical protein
MQHNATQKTGCWRYRFDRGNPQRESSIHQRNNGLNQTIIFLVIVVWIIPVVRLWMVEGQHRVRVENSCTRCKPQDDHSIVS